MKKNIFLPVIVMVLLLLTWLMVITNMSETAKFPAAFGGFFAGWYAGKIFNHIKEGSHNDVARRFDSQ